MSAIESEESYDDTSIISDLLGSAETMQTSTVETCDTITIKMPLQRKDELQMFSNASAVSTTFCDTSKNTMIPLQQEDKAIGVGLLNSTQYSDMEDLNKMHIRQLHIPYILNGELYQIQTQDGENVTVKCCHCPPDRVYRGSVRSTGNFHMHIKRRHPDLLEKLHEMKVNALLERRDRLMRNRKVTHRNNRNRSTNSIDSLNDICSFKNEENPEIITTPTSEIIMDSTTETSLMHTHKLKIKTVFQRHQMQKKEAEETRNWNNVEYVVMPIGNSTMNEEYEQPINYSLKSQEKCVTNVSVLSSNSLNINLQSQQLEDEKGKQHDRTNETYFESFSNLNHQQNKNKLICDNHTTPISSIPCPSTHQCGIENNHSYNSFAAQHQHVPVIKPEHLLLGVEMEAIDLTINTDSGIFSSTEDNDSENNNNSTRIINNRAGTQKTNSANIAIIDAERNNDSGSNSGTSTAKLQELFIRVENSLRDIQREMNVRNQIESNRMFLDVAKFKFLNPAFQFNL